MTVTATLLVLDYPGRRPEAPVSAMHLERGGYDCGYPLTSPLPTALSTPAYASELCARLRPGRPAALVAYCAAAPLAITMAGMLSGPTDPVPVVLLDPQPTTRHEITLEYREVVRQIAGPAPDARRPPLLDIGSMLGTPETLVESIAADLRRRACLTLATHGVDVDEADGPVTGLVGVYVEWLTFLVAAHHGEPQATRGPVLQVISAGHPDDAGWLHASALHTARIPCERRELAENPMARAAVLDFLRRDG